MKQIKSFRGKYNFLSNFYRCTIYYNGLSYFTVEHAFQAQKSIRHEDRLKIWNADTPGQAKAIGRKIELRADWEEVKLQVMADLIWIKFSYPELKEKIIRTGDAQLIEGNTWGDRYWGVYREQGENHLGRILMAVRSLLIETVPARAVLTQSVF